MRTVSIEQAKRNKPTRLSTFFTLLYCMKAMSIGHKKHAQPTDFVSLALSKIIDCTVLIVEMRITPQFFYHTTIQGVRNVGHKKCAQATKLSEYFTTLLKNYCTTTCIDA